MFAAEMLLCRSLGLESRRIFRRNILKLKDALAHKCCYASTSADGFSPKIAVIGSGPAAFYFTAPILRLLNGCCVDMFEKLPVPFGLVRYGVAPDHPEVKNCTNQFHKTVDSAQGRFVFRGNVNVGLDISVDELRSVYDIVVFCNGSEKDRRLGIPGEDATNCLSARSFVGWYNGHPDFADLKVDLNVDHVCVLGHGNVALDVARILLSPIDVLASTDIPEYALESLKTSRVKHVTLIGRRGPVEVAFTIKEFREMMNLPKTSHLVHPKECEILDTVIPTAPRGRKRLLELLRKSSLQSASVDESKGWVLRFLRSPKTILTEQNKVSGVELAVNRLERQGNSGGNITRAVSTGEVERLDCEMIITSVGYQSIPIPGVPFDSNRNVIDTTDGFRVTGSPGVYACGWAARGPNGVIATTQMEAKNCATAVSEDVLAAKVVISNSNLGTDHIDKILDSKSGAKRTSWSDWEIIDKDERTAGEKLGKPREKLLMTK